MDGTELSPWLVLAALPLVLALATAFTKATVTLGALRLGLSAEALLPLPVVFAVSLLVTAMVMAPTAAALWEGIEAAGGLSAVASGPLEGWGPVLEPLTQFVRRHADPDELTFFAQLQSRSIDDPLVLVSAVVVTELAEAFAIAVVILVPMVVVDLLVAQGLVLVGLVNQPTAIVTAPIKVLLFLAVGGWDVLIGGLVEGYR